jgi:phosphatidyl-myo-inositol dimannoside synthase
VFVTNSRWTTDLCRAVLGELGLDPELVGVHTVPLGTDPARFRPGLDATEVRARYGLPSGRWLITVARLAAHKGIDTGLHILAAVRREQPDLGYLVVGSGVKQRELERLARELGVADRVRFLSNVPDGDLPALYNAADIYLGLSRPAELMVEGFGISLVEASASGLPVIAGSGGGIPDAVRDGETGLLVDATHPAAGLAAVRRLLDDAELRRRMGAAGRHAVQTYYNWDRVAADVLRIGREVAARHAARLAC